MNASDREKVDAVIDGAIAEAITPGLCAAVQVGVGDNAERVVFSYGALTFEAPLRPTHADTVFDLASLTKALCTTPLVALALERAVITLDEEPFPSWPGVSVTDLLLHRSGLPDWKPFFEGLLKNGLVGLPRGRSRIIEAVLATMPSAARPRDTLYSDLGFIALGHLLEERLEDRLDRLFHHHLAPHFGPSPPQFVCLYEEGVHPALPQVAPTEQCAWRGRVIQGQVHDDNAFAMGGVAGHAGLFGNVASVVLGGEMILRALHGDPPAPFLRHLGEFAAAPGERGLGFDRATPGGTTGDVLGPRAVGHLGFTGTSLWVDPDAASGRGAIYALLSNRVHPLRAAKGIRDLRIAFHQAAAEWVRARV
jgi:CubicO group peptidase (beta-lactamase class C family)